MRCPDSGFARDARVHSLLVGDGHAEHAPQRQRAPAARLLLPKDGVLCLVRPRRTPLTLSSLYAVNSASICGSPSPDVQRSKRPNFMAGCAGTHSTMMSGVWRPASSRQDVFRQVRGGPLATYAAYRGADTHTTHAYIAGHTDL
jgi:hypothetical protein